MDTKQVIVMRKDLNMRKGKMIAQGSHASMAFIIRHIWAERDEDRFSASIDEMRAENLDPDEIRSWIRDSFAKVCLYVESETELEAIHRAAKDSGLFSVVIVDNGRTEFHGIPTKTCLAIGPHEVSRIDAVTGHLKLL